MSEFATELDVAAAAGGDPGVAAGSEPAQISEAEWSQFRDGVAQVGEWIAAQQQGTDADYADYGSGYDEPASGADPRLDPFDDAYNPDEAIGEYLAQVVAPYAQVVEELQAQIAQREGIEQLDGLLDELGVPEEQTEVVETAAKELLFERTLTQVLASAGRTPDEIVGALNSVDPAWRQWGDQWAQWAASAALAFARNDDSLAEQAVRDAASGVRSNLSAAGPGQGYVPAPGADELSLVRKFAQRAR